MFKEDCVRCFPEGKETTELGKGAEQEVLTLQCKGDTIPGFLYQDRACGLSVLWTNVALLD